MVFSSLAQPCHQLSVPDSRLDGMSWAIQDTSQDDQKTARAVHGKLSAKHFSLKVSVVKKNKFGKKKTIGNALGKSPGKL